MSKKIYVGKGWEKKFNNGGSVISISLKVAEISKLEPNQYGEVRLQVQAYKEPDAKSKATHSVTVDEYYHKQEEGNSPF